MNRDQRLCHCRIDVEMKIHFLFECGLYHDVRSKYDIGRDLCVAALLNNERYIRYIEECMETMKQYV